MGKFNGADAGAGIIAFGLLAGGLPLLYGGLILGTRAYVEALNFTVRSPVEFISNLVGFDSQTAENIGIDAAVATGLLLPIVLIAYLSFRSRSVGD
jgi:hypothetical protein